jgi:hypothetical protein
MASIHRDTLQALPGSDRAIAVAFELVRGLGLEPT